MHKQSNPTISVQGRQSLTQSSQQSIPSRTKMLTFIDSLYSRFKLLNKLSEQQSNNFQTEIIQMLIDEDECVDHQLYEETVEKIGLGTFVLEVLGAIVQKRNKFKNQYQMNRNLQEIAKQLQKQRLDMTNRKKELDKRELGLKKKEEQLISIIKEKAISIEQQTKSTLLNLQQDTKKRIKTLLNSLKLKQKQLNDKATSFKQSLAKLNDLQTKQKVIEQKLKLLQKKQKQRKSKESTQKQQFLANQQTTKKLTEMKNQITILQQGNKKLEDQVSRLNKKLKTNEMAYRHLKEETDRKLAKFNEITERLRVMGEEKEKMGQEVERMEKEVDQGKKINDKLRKQLEKLSKEIQRLEKVNKQSHQLPISSLQKQAPISLSHKQTPDPRKTHQNLQIIFPPDSNNQNIFQQLDISNIQNPFLFPDHDQQQFMLTDRLEQQLNYPNNNKEEQQDISILHHVAQSIIMIEKTNFQRELNELSRTVDIQQQIIEWEGLGNSQVKETKHEQDQQQEEEESEDREREKNYVINMKQLSKLSPKTTSHGMKLKNHSLTINKNSIKQRTTPFNQPKPSSKPSSKPLSKAQSSSESLQEQRQLITLGQSSILHKTPQTINSSNIALFENYFASTEKSSLKEITNTKPNPKSLHDQLLEQINTFNSGSQQNNPCLSLETFSKQFLLNIIKRISSPEIKYPRTLVQPFLQLLLVALEPCNCPAHQRSLTILFTQQLIVFLQEILLKFQAIIKEIEEKSVIILSRILLSYDNQIEEHSQVEKREKFTLKEKYLKSLKVKLLLEKDQFIKSNLKFLMEYE